MPELTEPIDSINAQLIDLFGIDTVNGLPIWRVVWSEDQFEMRLGTYDDHTPAGIYLRTVTEVRNVPKYRQWIKEKYVLERLVVVPEVSRAELPTAKISYEPIFVFQNRWGGYLPPKLNVAKLAVDAVYAAQGHGKINVYKDPEAGLDSEDILAQRDEQLKTLEEDLYGNETDVSDALTYGEGVVISNTDYLKKEN